MAKSKSSARKLWFIGLFGLLSMMAGLSYREIYPPLPPYLKLPAGSRTQVSRRFHTFMWGPKYYCRIYSPLPAWQTANYMKKSSNLPGQTLRATKDIEYAENMNGWALKRNENYIDVGYSPNEIQGEGTEIYPTMRVWPEQNGSTIEFYYATGF